MEGLERLLGERVQYDTFHAPGNCSEIPFLLPECTLAPYVFECVSVCVHVYMCVCGSVCACVCVCGGGVGCGCDFLLQHGSTITVILLLLSKEEKVVPLSLGKVKSR